MRLPRTVHRAMNRLNIDVTHYDRSYEFRRNRVLNHLGIRDLIDVGANTGQYAQQVRFHGYQHRIWSAEPLQSAYLKLARAAESDPLWTVERIAVSSEPGELTLHVSSNSQFSSVAAPVNGLASERPEVTQVGTEVVPMDTLDNLMAKAGLEGPIG